MNGIAALVVSAGASSAATPPDVPLCTLDAISMRVVLRGERDAAPRTADRWHTNGWTALTIVGTIRDGPHGAGDTRNRASWIRGQGEREGEREIDPKTVRRSAIGSTATSGSRRSPPGQRVAKPAPS